MIRNIKNYIISLLWRRFSKSSSKTYYHELLNSLQIPLTKELTEEQIDEIQSFTRTIGARNSRLMIWPSTKRTITLQDFSLQSISRPHCIDRILSTD